MAKPESRDSFVVVSGADKPGAPTSLAADVINPDGGEFSWVNPVRTGGSKLFSIRFYARTPQGSGSYSLLIETGFDQSPLLIEGLSPSTAYDMYITAKNSSTNEGPASNVIQFTTDA